LNCRAPQEIWRLPEWSSEQSNALIQEPRHEIHSAIIQLAQATAISAVMGPIWLSLGNSDWCGAKPDSHEGPQPPDQRPFRGESTGTPMPNCVDMNLKVTGLQAAFEKLLAFQKLLK
jgi:hypothetical protein